MAIAESDAVTGSSGHLGGRQWSTCGARGYDAVGIDWAACTDGVFVTHDWNGRSVRRSQVAGRQTLST